jgi:hypothetical protein
MYAILVHQVAYFGLWLVRNPAQVVFLSVFVVAPGMAAGGNPPVFAAFLTDRLQGPRFGFLLGRHLGCHPSLAKVFFLTRARRRSNTFPQVEPRSKSGTAGREVQRDGAPRARLPAGRKAGPGSIQEHWRGQRHPLTG